jgi:hypothetical protein
VASQTGSRGDLNILNSYSILHTQGQNPCSIVIFILKSYGHKFKWNLSISVVWSTKHDFEYGVHTQRLNDLQAWRVWNLSWIGVLCKKRENSRKQKLIEWFVLARGRTIKILKKKYVHWCKFLWLCNKSILCIDLLGFYDKPSQVLWLATSWFDLRFH